MRRSGWRGVSKVLLRLLILPVEMVLKGWDTVMIFCHLAPSLKFTSLCVCVCFFCVSLQRAFDEVLCGGFVPDFGAGVPDGDRGAGGPRPALPSATAADVRRACQAGDD